MSLFRKSNSKTSSRRQIAIKGAQDGVLILPGNKYRAVLQTSAVNFGLKTEAEQSAITDSYQRLLNSLPVPIQIMISIREMDIDGYLDVYRAGLDDDAQEVYKENVKNYEKYVRQLVKDSKILERLFYVIIPFDDIDRGGFEIARDQLAVNVGIVEGGLNDAGIQTRRLDSVEILDLFYRFYNPQDAKQ